jgi:hypothetical protein
VSWGEDDFQMAARRVTLGASLHGPDGLVDRGDDGRLGPLLWKNTRVRRVGTRALCRFVFDVNDRTESELLASLPGMLDRIDAWIEAGVLNGEELNAADFTIGTSLCLLMYRPDLQPDIESRPAGKLADRVIPERPRAGEPAAAGG